MVQLPPAPDDAWGRFVGRTEGARELWIRPGHLTERHPAIELLCASEAIFVVARWAHEDFARVESLHWRVFGSFGWCVSAGSLASEDLDHAYDRDPEVHRAAVLADLADAFEAGRLVLHATTREHAPGPPPIEPIQPLAPPPLRPRPASTWIEVSLVDAEGRVVAEEPVLIVDPSGSRTTLTTGEQGVARLGGIDPGICEVSFPRIDGREWARKGEAFRPGSDAVAKVHRVGPAECMTRIAYDFGFRSPDTLYRHDSNLELRTLRPNPDLLWPGDEVQILERDERVDSAETGRRHGYRLVATARWLRVVLHDAHGRPLCDHPYVLRVEGRPPVNGSTQPDGLLEVPIPPWAVSASIETERWVWPVTIAALLPVREVADAGREGAQQRLQNLGFAATPTDTQRERGGAPAREEAPAPAFDPEVWRFQRSAGLTDRGSMDEATIDAAVRLHKV